jgi:dipeptidyl-peptidase 9
MAAPAPAAHALAAATALLDDVRVAESLSVRGKPLPPQNFSFVGMPDAAAPPPAVFICDDASGLKQLFWTSERTRAAAHVHGQAPSAAAPSAAAQGLPPGWQLACAFASAPPTSDRELSKEEQLLRERMRMQGFGVTSFQLRNSDRQLLVPAGGRLFCCELPARDTLAAPVELRPVEPRQPPASRSPRMDAKWAPAGPLIGFVRDDDLWLCDTRSGEELQLTALRALGLRAGVAEYIMQEEFDRFTGYWWAPQRGLAPQQLRLLFFVVDDREVPSVTIANPALGEAPETFQFPRAGERNATSWPHVATITLPPEGAPLSSARVDVAKVRVPLREWFPWIEYWPRAAWGVDADTFYLQVLDRAQQRLAVLRLSVARDVLGAGAASAADVLLHEERTDVWINVTDIFHPLEAPGGTVLFASEASGFRHLCLLRPGAPPVPVTKGSDWLVLASDEVAVDEARGLVFFHATRDTPLEKHLYAAPLPPARPIYSDSYVPPQPHRLTALGSSHSVTLSADCHWAVDVHSSVSLPPSVHFSRVAVEGERVSLQSSSQLATRAMPPMSFPFVVPELFTIRAADDATLLHGALFVPPGVKAPPSGLPAVVYTYGGPHVQLVTNSWTLTSMGRVQLLCAIGLVVAVVDNRGSWNRGLAFEGALRNRMGSVEIDDQLRLVRYLCEERRIADPRRIGITGWSYGGYMTLMAMAKAAHVFAAGIAGAPVTLWEAYDTGYTERYMSTPAANREGYRSASVLAHARGLPLEPGRLTIVHGLMDENVHFTHTASLLQQLVRLGRPYDLKVFPGERHGVRDEAALVYLERIFVSVFRRTLMQP